MSPDQANQPTNQRLDRSGQETKLTDPAGAVALFEQGAMFHRAADFQQAEACYRKALTKDPGLHSAWCKLWLRKALENDTNEVLEGVETDTDLDPWRDLPAFQVLIDEFKGRGSSLD